MCTFYLASNSYSVDRRWDRSSPWWYFIFHCNRRFQYSWGAWWHQVLIRIRSVWFWVDQLHQGWVRACYSKADGESAALLQVKWVSSCREWRCSRATTVAPIEPCAQLPCNTRFIKGHKSSNHICARIKSHVYTTEWTIYHSTYHVKRYNKANTNVIYYINDKMSDTNMRKRRTSTKLSLKLGATGTSTGRPAPRSPRTPGSSGWTPLCRRELSSSRVSPKRTRGKV